MLYFLLSIFIAITFAASRDNLHQIHDLSLDTNDAILQRNTAINGEIRYEPDDYEISQDNYSRRQRWRRRHNWKWFPGRVHFTKSYFRREDPPSVRFYDPES